MVFSPEGSFVQNCKEWEGPLVDGFRAIWFWAAGRFLLPPETLRLFLCTAAHHVLHDRDYFNCVESWFRDKVERTQSLGSEAWSACFMCRVACFKLLVPLHQRPEEEQVPERLLPECMQCLSSFPSHVKLFNKWETIRPAVTMMMQQKPQNQ